MVLVTGRTVDVTVAVVALMMVVMVAETAVLKADGGDGSNSRGWYGSAWLHLSGDNSSYDAVCGTSDGGDSWGSGGWWWSR